MSEAGEPRGRVLITGGTGLIGSRLIERLRAAGVTARCLTRSQKTSSDASLEYAQWDGVALNAETLRGCRQVVHLAGEPVFGGPVTAARKARILSSRVDSTRSIVAAMQALPADERPDTLVCASGVGYYGDRGDDPLDEASAPGGGFLADVCRQWEAAAQAAQEFGVRTVSLRIGIVLSRAGGALPMMAMPFRMGAGGRMGDGNQWVPWIHIDDLVGLLIAALEDPEMRGAVNAVAPNPVRNRELTSAMAQTLRRPALLPVPAFVLKLALGELSGELLGSRLCTPKVALDHGFEFTHTEIETALEAELH
jgi:hypothetical protein